MSFLLQTYNEVAKIQFSIKHKKNELHQLNNAIRFQ